jgi:hypothetical protein
MDGIVSWKAILGNGLLLPVSLLVAFDFASGEASRGKGGFEAAWLVIVGIAIVRGLLIADCWLFFIEWRSHWRVFLSGLVLPAFVGVTQGLLLYGPLGLKRNRQ